MHQLLFQLLRVAIGTQTNLSRLPAEDEWVKLYRTAEKQSILGVCFAGLQNMGANADDGFARIGMSKSLYLTWMGMAVVIQKKNEMVNRQCVELQAKLTVRKTMVSSSIINSGRWESFPNTLIWETNIDDILRNT